MTSSSDSESVGISTVSKDRVASGNETSDTVSTVSSKSVGADAMESAGVVANRALELKLAKDRRAFACKTSLCVCDHTRN